MGFDKEMQKALEADAKKLSDLTGDDHFVFFCDDCCPVCGGEGVTFECFDGCCEDADIGCDDCTVECACVRKET